MKHIPILPRAATMVGLLAALTAVVPALGADRNVPTQYATIQAAIDAASSGDTIRIGPGVYVEQLLIVKKTLTMLGTPGAVIRAKTGMIASLNNTGLPDGGVDCTVPLLGAVKSEVVLKGLTFEGEHLGEAYQDCSYSAITFSGTGGRLENCIVRGFRSEKSIEIDGYGFGAANNPTLGTPTVHIDIVHCTFADNGISINVRGAGTGAANPATERLTFSIADNTITGIGPTALGAQIGLIIGAGASGDVKRNTITDHLFTDSATKNLASVTLTNFPSIGVLGIDLRHYFYQLSTPAALLPVTFQENTFSNNELHMALFKANGWQVVNNGFDGSGTTYRPTGLILSGDNALVASNRFSSIPTGITLLGKDPDWGIRLGIATNPQLMANRFCDSKTPVETQPMATGVIEQGTVLCPFPDPTLTIATAVILSWPAYTAGWFLETTANATGPWTAFAGSPTFQDGQNTVTVDSSTQQRFFRLRQP